MFYCNSSQSAAHQFSFKNFKNCQITKGWEKAGIAQLLDESFSLPPEDPFEETEGSVEISQKGHVTILSILDDDSEEQEDFFYYCKTDFQRNTAAAKGQHIGFVSTVG